MPLAVLTRITTIEDFLLFAAQGWLSDRDYINLAPLPPHLRTAFGLPQFCGQKLRLSAETIRQHHQKHKELCHAAYADICPAMLKNGIWLRVPQQRNGINSMRVCGYVEYAQKIWKMGIKITAKDEIYLSTLFRSNENQLKSDIKNGGEIK